MLKSMTVAWLLLIAAGSALASEDLEFRAPAGADGVLTATAMRSLAERALPVYKNPDRAQFLANLSALQMVAGSYAAASATRDSLDELRRRTKESPVDLSVVYDFYARARALEVNSHVPFEQAFGQVFRSSVTPLDDLSAFTITRWLATPLSVFRNNFQAALDRARGQQRLSLAEAVDLVWSYLSFDAFRSFGPVVKPLIAADDNRRYIIDDTVLVRTPERASISAVTVRPRNAPAPVPSLLEFTTYVDSGIDATDCAAHGYAGVVAFARGRARSPDALVPYEHDGEDARAVIAWIARQSWSNGRVGMYGTGYSGFAAWAAAKRPAPALKALAVSSPYAPGLDAPAGERVPGMPASIFRRWLRHPSFDRYWQQMLPYQDDFSQIDIPVLTTTGYFDSRQADALYYFTQHLAHNPNADATLLLGPYDDEAMQRGPLGVLGGYALDRAALVDLKALRFQWFDHVLRGAAVPGGLTARVNFEVMGANEWQHAASLEQMANGSVRLYLDPSRAGGHFRLSGHAPSRRRYIEFQIPLENGVESGSGNAADVAAGGEKPGAAAAPEERPLALVSREVVSADSVTFVSGPLHRPMVMSGSVSGLLSFATNQRRLGLHVTLYELFPNGNFFKLFAPADDFDVREAYADRGSREGVRGRPRPLVPGRRQRFPFEGQRLTSVEMQEGARIVLVLAVEPLADPQQKAPSLDVRWYGGSYVELPVRRPAEAAAVSRPAEATPSARPAPSAGPAPVTPPAGPAQPPRGR